MNYLFTDKWHDVPTYSTYPNSVLVAVEYSLPLSLVQPRDQRVIEKSWRRVWRFILAEGPVSTVRKIRSKFLQGYINGDYHVVLAVGKRQDSNEPVVCLGTRHPRSAEVMLFRRELIEPMASAPKETAFVYAVDQAMAAPDFDASSLDSISGYNLYSDLAPPDQAVRLIRRVASFLAVGERPQNATSSNDLHPIRPPVSKSSPTIRANLHGAVVIGAGDYARTQIIPALKRAGVALRTVVDLEPYLAEYARRKFGFAQAATDWREAIQQPETQTVIVASYHDSHAEIAAAALEAGKKVFLEKPPAVTRDDLALLLRASSPSDSFLEIGYNRRFAPFTRKAKQLLDKVSGPTSIVCLVKEVEIPDCHWYRWPREGSRITGNLCHWIDLGIYLLGTGCEPAEMIVTGPNLTHADDEKGLNVVFRDGSSLSIITSARGDGTLGVQELIEIRRGSLSIKLDDYRRLIATNGGRVLCRLYHRRNKGHAAMYDEALRRINENRRALYTSRELELTTLLTITATEMTRNGDRSTTFSADDFRIANRS